MVDTPSPFLYWDDLSCDSMRNKFAELHRDQPLAFPSCPPNNSK
jgi:hypothetical protein